eukprot:TRINITY_DN10673_c0_g1_i1.p1 TRINITY_DN10673_c0_g1~~TRINITY_DN10673_c0_g1_i1.p1  ORF type:complete len:699 (+),score=143.63 TRINITY_DN10673_c0_g1_i1:228-2099(+)
MVHRNIETIHEELIDLKKKGLQLHTEDVREELIKAQLEGYQPHVDALVDDDKYLTMPVADFKGQVSWLLGEAKKLDPHGRSTAANDWQRVMQQLVLDRKDADDAKGIADDPFDLSLSRIAQKEGLEEYQAGLEAAKELAEEVRSAHQKRLVAVDDAMRLLTERTGAEFVFVPGGTYTLGGEPEEVSLYPDPRAHPTPRGDYKLQPFFISKQLLSTKHLLKLAKEAVKLVDLEALTSDMSLKHANYTPVERSDPDGIHPWTGAPGGAWVERFVATEKSRGDGVAELTYFRAQQLAQALGGQLPNWKHWEAAARGLEGHRYPWGNEIVEDRLYVMDAGAGDEGMMSFAVSIHQERMEQHQAQTPDHGPAATSPTTSPKRAARVAKARKIIGFGEYGSTSSVYGMGALVRAGCEWNSMEPNEFQPLRTRVYSTTAEDPPVSHILRSLSGFRYAQPPAPDSHTNFTGPTLAAYGKPGEVRRAGFRIAFSLSVDPVAPVERRSVDELAGLLGRNEFSCLQCLGRIENLERSPTTTASCVYYYTKGVRIDAEDGVIHSVLLFSGPDETRDYATCAHVLDGVSLTMAGLEGMDQLPQSLREACVVDVYNAAHDENDEKTRRTFVLKLSTK